MPGAQPDRTVSPYQAFSGVLDPCQGEAGPTHRDAQTEAGGGIISGVQGLGSYPRPWAPGAGRSPPAVAAAGCHPDPLHDPETHSPLPGASAQAGFPLKPPSKESPSVDKRRLNRRQPPSPGRVVCAFSDRKTASPVCNQVTSQGSSWSLTSSRIPSSLCDKPLPLPGVPPKVQLGRPWQAKPGSPRFSAHLNKDLRIKGQCTQGPRPMSAQAWPGPHRHTYSYTYVLPQVGPTALCSGGAPPRKASSSASPSSSSQP